MKSLLLLSTFLITFSSITFAEEEIVDIWKCKLKDGKTMKDATESSANWTKFMNANVDGGGIHSYFLWPMVGNQEEFMYFDIYPDLNSWSASVEAIKSEEGSALIKELVSVAECSSNSLYSAKKN